MGVCVVVVGGCVCVVCCWVSDVLSDVFLVSCCAFCVARRLLYVCFVSLAVRLRVSLCWRMWWSVARCAGRVRGVCHQHHRINTHT